MTNLSPTILLVGCGNMGRAMLEGWIHQGTATDKITVIDPVSSNLPAGINQLDSIDSLNFTPDVVVLAVKPQILDSVVADYKSLDSVFISIAAGKTLSFFEQQLGNDKAIIRTMPNLPAMIGEGITAACANRHCTDLHKQYADLLLSAVGSVLWLDEEVHMDAVTGLSGSGPAYVFYLMECFVNAGVEAGLPKELALELALHTFRGTAALAHDSNETLAQLRDNVTSPGGTTQAGLDVLMSDDLSHRIIRTVEAAKQRARELAT